MNSTLKQILVTLAVLMIIVIAWVIYVNLQVKLSGPHKPSHIDNGVPEIQPTPKEIIKTFPV